MPATRYPKADCTSEWFGDDFAGTDMGGVDKVLLHSTEGASWPPYAGGSQAPNLTYHPLKRAWRQHFPLNRSARALVDNPKTLVRENRDRVVQVEIIAVCDPSVYRRSKKLLPIDDLSEGALEDLGDFLAFMHREYRVPLVAAPRWLPYPRSAGNSPVRMNSKVYDAFRGVLGHQHASGNAHGDPGSLNIPAIIRAANRAARPTNLTPIAVPPPAAKPAPAALVRPAQEKTMYLLLRTPDGRFWGCYGLQITHLENGDILRAFAELHGLDIAKPKPVTYELLENYQRIT